MDHNEVTADRLVEWINRRPHGSPRLRRMILAALRDAEARGEQRTGLVEPADPAPEPVERPTV
jgi:hypothetical protein